MKNNKYYTAVNSIKLFSKTSESLLLNVELQCCLMHTNKNETTRLLVDQ